jgi:hypothetical protein
MITELCLDDQVTDVDLTQTEAHIVFAIRHTEPDLNNLKDVVDTVRRMTAIRTESLYLYNQVSDCLLQYILSGEIQVRDYKVLENGEVLKTFSCKGDLLKRYQAYKKVLCEEDCKYSTSTLYRIARQDYHRLQDTTDTKYIYLSIELKWYDFIVLNRLYKYISQSVVGEFRVNLAQYIYRKSGSILDTLVFSDSGSVGSLSWLGVVDPSVSRLVSSGLIECVEVLTSEDDGAGEIIRFTQLGLDFMSLVKK